MNVKFLCALFCVSLPAFAANTTYQCEILDVQNVEATVTVTADTQQEATIKATLSNLTQVGDVIILKSSVSDLQSDKAFIPTITGVNCTAAK